jgi:hypothetical protein
MRSWTRTGAASCLNRYDAIGGCRRLRLLILRFYFGKQQLIVRRINYAVK